MPLLAQTLSVWEIAHRWGGMDPDLWRFRLPLQVRDHARVLFEAILNSEIECSTLQMNKWRQENGEDEKPYFIRYHLECIHDLIAGKRYDRKLMKWAVLDRYEVHQWCERHQVPLPEFWFPSGWGLSYDWKADDQLEPDGVSDRVEKPSEVRASARMRMVAQEIALAIWAERPDMTIADMIKQPDVVRYAKAGHYQPDTVRGWLSEVAPEAVKNKRGRPRKNPAPSNDATSASI